MDGFAAVGCRFDVYVGGEVVDQDPSPAAGAVGVGRARLRRVGVGIGDGDVDVVALESEVECAGSVGVPDPRAPRAATSPRPRRLFADRGYDYDKYRRLIRARGITPKIARRGTLHGSGLGKTRWVVERTFAWLHQFKRLRIRYEIRADLHLGFLQLACSIICLRRTPNLILKRSVRRPGVGGRLATDGPSAHHHPTVFSGAVAQGWPPP